MEKLIIPLATPSKKNSKIFNKKTNRMFCSKNYQEWHKAASLFINANLKRKDIDCCFIVMIFTHGDRRRRDSDNGVNSIFDTLVDVKTLIDDSWQNIPTHTVINFFNEKNPSCEIRIYSLDEVNLYTEDIKLLTLNCKEGMVNYFSHKK